MTAPILSVSGLNKTWPSGLQALKNINLDIHRGEIFALLGPNGAGKTTLISIICGLVMPGGGSVTVENFDVVRDYRRARRLIGLVPQELTTDAFETVWATVSFSRGLFGKPRSDAYINHILESLSLADKKHAMLRTLSGGMKRRVLIAKALAHEPRILFLDEPTAGVDVALRQDMWRLVRRLRDDGVTIILTTHYIEEAEDMADRVGIIHNGEIIRVQDKRRLMRELGKKELILHLREPIDHIPPRLERFGLTIGDAGKSLLFSYDPSRHHDDVAALLQQLSTEGIGYTDLDTRESSLEDIFVSLLKNTETPTGNSHHGVE
ncbi:MAG TPA: ABC transporter ATP-binding protein [Burkholderiaceae bacterium]|nr:ABC transporter ATP-binding protein [Burkholderiaceae bacterium]